MIRINLLPVRAARKRETVKRQAIYAVTGLAVVLLGCAWSFISVASEISDVEETNAELQADIDRLTKIIGVVEETKAKKVELQQKIDVIERLKRDRTGPVHLLDEIADAIPDKAWITGVTEKGDKVNIVGQAINMEAIADFTERLRRSEHIDKVEVGPTRRVQSKESELFFQEFLLIATQKDLNPKPPEPPPEADAKGKKGKAAAKKDEAAKKDAGEPAKDE